MGRRGDDSLLASISNILMVNNVGVLESVILVVGTLAGTLVGIFVTYLFNRRVELERRKHEREIEYRDEIKKHMDDLVKPLFNLLQNLWGSLAVLQVSMRQKEPLVKGKTINDLLTETRNANQALRSFIKSKYDEMSFLLPGPFPWIFAPLDELVQYRIIESISQGKEPTDDITVAINSLMKIQKDLRRIVGFEIDVKMESVYPFKKATHSRNSEEDTAEEKFEFLVGGLKLFIAVLMGAFTTKLMESYWAMPNLSSRIMAGVVIVVAVLAYSMIFYFVLYNVVRSMKRWIKKRKKKA